MPTFREYGCDFDEEHEVIACIEHLTCPNEEEETDWQVSCFDGIRIVKIGTNDPHHFNHHDYQDAYSALFQMYPSAALIGTDRWYMIIARALQK